MTSITEAVFKGRSRRGTPAPPDTSKHSTAPMTSQFMARKAIEAVLAGGYTKCEPKLPRQPLPPAPAKIESHGYGRVLTIWVAIFGLAGLFGIATSRLPGHAVKAKQAGPAPVEILAEELAEQPEPVRPVAAVAAPQPLPETTLEQPLDAAESAALQVPLLRAQLRPVSKRHSLLTDSQVMGAAPVADDAPLAAQTAASVRTATNSPALEEVLYEGEPAKNARTVAPRAAVAAVSGSQAKAESGRDGSSSSGGLKVEGIFWDKVRPMAIIAGNIVEVGSEVGEYKVSSIQQGQVILTGASGVLELRP